MISRLTWAIALAIFPTVTIATSRGDELLVLRNGFTIKGRISRIADRYVVRIASGSETRIPLSAVEFRCRDFEDAYQQKASVVGWEQTNERVELIRWCLRHELYDQARAQVAILERVDPRGAALPQLRRRLELLSGSKVARTPVSSAAFRLKSDELELLMRELPEDSVEQFTTTVQPLLLNRCSTGGCHGSRTGSPFRLIRPPFGRELQRPFTQRNLHAVLQAIDNQDSSSRSFAQALHPHGPDKRADPNLTESQMEQIRSWMTQLARTRSTIRPPRIAAPATLLQASTSRTSKGRPDPSHRSAAAAGDESSAPRQANRPPGGSEDPFDPEVFNRRYHAGLAEELVPDPQPEPARPREFPGLPESSTKNRRR